jgi:hypothetical protein
MTTKARKDGNTKKVNFVLLRFRDFVVEILSCNLPIGYILHPDLSGILKGSIKSIGPFDFGGLLCRFLMIIES